MRIALRGMGSRDLLEELERSGASELVGGIRDELFFDAVWPSAQLSDFLREAARRGSLDLNPWMEFGRKEVERSTFLRLRCRKVLSESRADFERMRADVNRLSWLGDDPQRRFRLPDRLTLSKIRLKPNQIGGVGQWTAEYVIPRAVRTIFEEARFSGIDFRPVFHTRTGAPVEEYFQLYSDHPSVGAPWTWLPQPFGRLIRRNRGMRLWDASAMTPRRWSRLGTSAELASS